MRLASVIRFVASRGSRNPEIPERIPRNPPARGRDKPSKTATDPSPIAGREEIQGVVVRLTYLIL